MKVDHRGPFLVLWYPMLWMVNSIYHSADRASTTHACIFNRFAFTLRMCRGFGLPPGFTIDLRLETLRIECRHVSAERFAEWDETFFLKLVLCMTLSSSLPSWHAAHVGLRFRTKRYSYRWRHGSWRREVSQRVVAFLRVDSGSFQQKSALDRTLLA